MNWETLRICYSFWADGKHISTAHAIKLSKIANLSPPVLRPEAKFTGAVQSLLSYDRAFEEVYGTRLFDVSVTDIVEDRVSSRFLDTSS